jgi:pyruvate dehydrogenase E2 component (dihydrolipoyllysine-residue acetyltransferase)
MSRWEFKLPDIGEGITEGEIVSWRIKSGDEVKEDQPMVEIMTDKATVTITAPQAGTVVETRGQIGEIIAVHSVLVVFELDSVQPTRLADDASLSTRETNGATRIEDGAVGDGGRNRREAPVAASASRAPALVQTAVSAGSAYFNEKPLATPATRKLARDMNVDLRHVPPSGPQGRVTRRDVESFVRPAPGPSASHPAPLRETRPAGSGPLEERIPFAGLRRRIAQKMALSTRTAAHFTFVEECDATELKAMRQRLMADAETQSVKLTFLPFVVKATVAALKKHPMLNATLDESTNELVLRKYFHIGIATQTEAGLVVVVVRDADRKSILEIAREIDHLATEARAGRAKLEDLQGSTFTITSPGTKGGFFATPIINFPEVAILGVHRMRERPVVKNGQIVVADVLLLSLSFDHRIVDGMVGAAFAYEIIGYLERPERLMLEMA